MSTANKVLIHRWFEEVWNQKRESAIFELLHPDAQLFGLGERPSQAITAREFVPFWKTFITAIPNLTIAVESTVAEDEKVAARCSARGTHIGPGLGTPSNNTVSITGMCIAHIRNEKVYEAWNNFDFLALYQQIGIATLPQP